MAEGSTKSISGVSDQSGTVSKPALRRPARAFSRVTLGDVALHAGVGKTTVSDILNRNVTGKYPTETRGRVQRAVDELGYLPSRAAQQLVKGRSGQVGLFLTRDFSNPFFARVAHLAQQALAKANFRMQLTISTRPNPDDEAELIRQLRIDGVDAVLVGPVYEPIDIEQHQAIFRGQVPIVTFGGEISGPVGRSVDSVVLNADGAIDFAVAHLRELGHSRLAYVFAPPQRSQDERTSPVAPRLTRAGFDPNWIVHHADSGDYDDFRRQADLFSRKWLSTQADLRPTAVVCLNDQIALCLLASLEEMGVRVPTDLSVVGCDNLPGSAHFRPSLTTLDNHVDRMIDAAVELLQNRLSHPDSRIERRVIQPELIRRRSSASYNP